MTRVRDELKIISPLAWVLALAIYVCFSLFLFTVAIPRDRELSQWPTPGAALFSFGIPLILFIYLVLIGYINGDAKRRGMRRALWTLIAIFVPNAIGVILYFFMRDPILQPCPRCATQVRSNFAYCPNCGTQVAAACPNCRRPVEAGWKSCAYCGASLATPPAMPSPNTQQVNR